MWTEFDNSLPSFLFTCSGLANVSANPPYASPLLAALDDIVASVLPGVDYVLHEHALRLLHNLALFEKRRTGMCWKHCA